ncbi:MAG: helix-turn-helix transcriptional regulator [Gammaproteobacteria bacterium]|nr:helix-turn-helix transcriptional regulator [Gammaproteobacteria bacterium]
MIKCNLSIYMGREKMRVSDVARETGLNRSTITALYKENASRIDFATIEKLCQLFQCQVGDLFEYVLEGSLVSENTHLKGIRT